MAVDRDLVSKLRPRSERSWGFSVASDIKDTGQSTTVSHACGALDLQTDGEVVERGFSCYVRLTGPEAIHALYKDPNGDSIQCPILYKVSSQVVEFGVPYRGLKSVAAKNSRMVGTVVSLPKSVDDTSLTQPPTIDAFIQVSGNPHEQHLSMSRQRGLRVHHVGIWSLRSDVGLMRMLVWGIAA